MTTITGGETTFAPGLTPALVNQQRAARPQHVVVTRGER